MSNLCSWASDESIIPEMMADLSAKYVSVGAGERMMSEISVMVSISKTDRVRLYHEISLVMR